MQERKPEGGPGEKGRIRRLAPVSWLDPVSTDWHWLYALSTSDLDFDFIEAIEERVEDQERPRLESLFD